jgi:peroxiredoxin
MQNPWGGTVHTEIREHVFTLAKPTPESNVASICLLVEGSQLTSVGTEVPVEGGEVCKVSVPSWMVATMPTWWDLLLPIWEVDPPSEQVLEEAIVAHVNMNAHAVGRARLGANTLVHFAGEGAQSPLDALDEALGGLRGGGFESRSQPGDAAAGAGQPAREKPPLALCVVLPRGAFSEPRATVEKRLGSLAPDLDVLLSLTEDYEGSWSRAFGHGKGPGSYLLNARGDFVWKHQGAPEARAFEEIGRHLLNGSPLRYHALRLDLPRCGPAPDLLYPTSGGTRLALRRLRGRPVTLLFWKSWSRACIREILRLQSRREEEGERVILAIVSGEDPGRLPRLAEEHGLSLTLVPDPQGRIARRYGISCWPTSVFVDPEGRVSGAHFGAHRGHHRHAAADAGSQRS